MAVSQSTSRVTVAQSGSRHISPKLRGLAASVPTRRCCFAPALYMDDMRVSMSAKKAPVRGAPLAKRCAFIGHLMNAENTAAVIGSLAPIAVNYAGVSVECHHVGTGETLERKRVRGQLPEGPFLALSSRSEADREGQQRLRDEAFANRSGNSRSLRAA